MKVLLKEIVQGPHDWFAWKPVVTRTKTENGYIYHLVWLRTVSRTRVSAMGLSQWLYEL